MISVADDPVAGPGVGRPLGTFDVDSTGQAVYRLSVEVPPGIGKVTPHLDLLYAHRSRNGLLGVGWGIAGLSEITRVKPTYAVDGYNGPVTNGPGDRLALDGERLINMSGAYGEPGTVYYTERHSWRRIIAHPGPGADGGFTVQARSGETWTYGTIEDSRVRGRSGAVSTWKLDATVDTHGNAVRYHYTDSPLLGDGTRAPTGLGACYPDTIEYGTAEAAGRRLVQFLYEQRPDSVVAFRAGEETRIAYRLCRIATSAGVNPAREYALAYTQSPASGFSLLSAIAECSPLTGESLAPTVVTWQDADKAGFSSGPTTPIDVRAQGSTVVVADVSGTGSSDVVQLWENGTDASLNATVYLATTGSAGTTFRRVSENRLGAFPSGTTTMPVCSAGDGRTDILVAYKGSEPEPHLHLALCRSNGSGFDQAVYWDTGDDWLDPDAGQHIAFFPMDVNGDGRTDLVEAYAHYDPSLGDVLAFRVYVSVVGSETKPFIAMAPSVTSDPAHPVGELGFFPMDVNGDGAMDLVRTWQRGPDAHVLVDAYVASTRPGATPGQPGTTAISVAHSSDLGTFEHAGAANVLPVDVNGDGIEDLVQIWSEQTTTGDILHLTTFFCDGAAGFVGGPDARFPDAVVDIDSLYPLDFNGSGLTSIASRWQDGDGRLKLTVYNASSSGQYAPGPTLDIGPGGTAATLGTFTPGDTNADGRADLVYSHVDGDTPHLVAWESTGRYPGLIARIANGIGGSLDVEFRPISDPSVYSQGPGVAYPVTPALQFPHRLAPSQYPCMAILGAALYVVFAYRSYSTGPDPLAYDYAYRYSYADGRMDLSGRGWEGFATASRTDLVTGRRVTTRYNQDFPLTGMVAETRVEGVGPYASDPRIPRDGTPVLLTRTAADYTVFPRGTGAEGNAVVEPLRSALREERYDYGEARFDYATGRSYTYDDAGNVACDAFLGYLDPVTGQPTDPSDCVYRYTSYLNEFSDQTWPAAIRFTRRCRPTRPTRTSPGCSWATSGSRCGPMTARRSRCSPTAATTTEAGGSSPPSTATTRTATGSSRHFRAGRRRRGPTIRSSAASPPSSGCIARMRIRSSRPSATTRASVCVSPAGTRTGSSR